MQALDIAARTKYTTYVTLATTSRARSLSRRLFPTADNAPDIRTLVPVLCINSEAHCEVPVGADPDAAGNAENG